MDEKNCINKRDVNIGRKFLIKTIGEDFCRQHKDGGVFAYSREECGIYCFLGIMLNPTTELNGLSAEMDDWDIYASCYVNDGEVTLYKCRLPQDVSAERC